MTRKLVMLGLLLTAGSAAALAQAPARKDAAAAPVAKKDAGTSAAEAAPAGPTILLLRGLDKITGRPTNIEAPIGKPVRFATLTITARFCYSTPPSETPETAAFVQIQDQRPDQTERRVFSGWMYASSPGLNAVEHPLYDVWVIGCRNSGAPPPASAMASTAPVKVASPDSSDTEVVPPPPPDAGQ